MEPMGSLNIKVLTPCRTLSLLGVELRWPLDPCCGSGRPPQEAFETVSSSWIGKLEARAAQGATGVGIEVAAAGVAKAIATYLGFSVG